MVALNGTYQADPNASNSYEPVPPGQYQVMMVNSKMNQKGTGISCEFDIVSGEYQGRKLFMNLALFHENPKAQEVGQRFLNDMCLASGKMAVSDTADLHGITMIAIVKIRKDDATQNDISGFKALDGAPAQQAPAPSPVPQLSPVPGQPVPGDVPGQPVPGTPVPDNTPPWKR